jgi:hypothetical protein
MVVRLWLKVRVVVLRETVDWSYRAYILKAMYYFANSTLWKLEHVLGQHQPDDQAARSMLASFLIVLCRTVGLIGEVLQPSDVISDHADNVCWHGTRSCMLYSPVILLTILLPRFPEQDLDMLR